MDAARLAETLEAISNEAHALSKGSNPAKPEARTKTEQVAALIERLSDAVRHTFLIDSEEVGTRPPLEKQQEVAP